VRVAYAPATNKGYYYVEEPRLSEEESSFYQRLINRLTYTAKLVPGMGTDAYNPQTLEAMIVERARQISEEFVVGGLHELTREKLIYYVKRDLVGYGAINPLMDDPELEDILVVGYDKPFIVMDRNWSDLDWLETNIQLVHDHQDQLARRLALKGRSSVSVAFPIVTCMLPSHDRVAVTYRYEASPSGTSISIRKFRKEPLTVPTLLDQPVFSPLMAAYLWTIIEDRGVIFVIGLPGSGKTVLCNALSLMLRPQYHPVTIEDFPELSLPQEHKQSLTARYSRVLRGEAKRGEQIGDVTQVDLLRHALRIRPDFLIVGEILTQEAPVMFQAINTGLGGSTSFHAADVHSAVTRLTEKTIGVDPAMLNMIDAVILIQRLRHPVTGKIIRRVTSIDEIRGIGDYNNAFTYSPLADVFSPSDPEVVVNKSVAMQKVATRRGISSGAMVEMLRDKVRFLEELQVRGIKNFADFSAAVKTYYAEQARMLGGEEETSVSMEGERKKSAEDALLNL